MTYGNIESDIRNRFQLGNHPLFFYYYDEQECRLMIIDNEDVMHVSLIAQSQLEPFNIFVTLREKAIKEFGKVDFWQQLFVRECLRHQPKNYFIKRRLISNLSSIRESLNRGGMKPAQINKLLKNVSQEVQIHFVDETFDDMKESDLEKQETACADCLDGDANPSVSSIFEHKTSISFLSKNESLFINELLSFDSPFRKNKDPQKLPKKATKTDINLVCGKCKVEVSDELHFECEQCKKLVLCEDCNVENRHKHPLKPVFIVNDSKQKLTALNRVFRRLRQSRGEFFFSVLKEGLFKDLPQR
jgi:hypothetical protein